MARQTENKIKKWYNNSVMLWTVIGTLIAAIIAFIIYNKTLVADIDDLKDDLKTLNAKYDELDLKDDRKDSEIYQLRTWKNDLETILIRHKIVKYESGVMK